MIIGTGFTQIITVAALCAVTFFVLGYFIRKYAAERKVKMAEAQARELIQAAGREAENIRREAKLEAKDLLYRTRIEFEKETKETRQQLAALEKRMLQKEENIDRKVDILDKKERGIQGRERNITYREKELEGKNTELSNLIEEEKQRLQRVSGLTAERAKQILLQRMEGEARLEAVAMIRRAEEEAKETADKKAKEIISAAIQRCAADHTVESTVSVVSLPSDEMKGRIIGREGRNIRALEIATGIDVIVDDTPEAVTLSGFDLVKREIARIALERLITDGRIHPARIEEVVARVKQEMEGTIREEGKRAAFDAGVHRLHPEEIKLLGRLKYRTSFGQNVLQHSKEVAYLLGVMASELGMDFALARRIGLLHDIGKAVDHEVEGTHAKIGADLAKRYGESEMIINAIAAHHQDTEPSSLLAVLVQAADAVSATRPGARRETLESYVKRLEKLESIADSFKGVGKAYAIQAGREVRVIVQPNKISDAQALVLAGEIRKKIEEGLEYPGQIKVMVIRETRAIEYAK
ncbi:MAG: ribonuclease Y [Candidatus Omnitrophica bacterium]|nr:ribonuclease Y [Candidatus Omnitrophota bacterium]MBU3933766.1 ribonuclease Y [Candidatus Omnitrophota bacterium]MBU4141186.1 ribonuclease Y [Candidatus Omnitrophota bacterium]